MFGFYRIAACVPRLKIADIRYNVQQILELSASAAEKSASVVLFPELAVTSYSCGELFHNTALLDETEKAAAELASAFSGTTIRVVGMPVRFKSRLFNAAVLFQKNKILGVVPKINLPNSSEFYERRYFSTGGEIRNETFSFAGFDNVPFGSDLIFEVSPEFRIGVEICEDLWTTIPPSSHLALSGATMLLNLSASNELVGKASIRRNIVRDQSLKCVAAYAMFRRACMNPRPIPCAAVMP